MKGQQQDEALELQLHQTIAALKQENTALKAQLHQLRQTEAAAAVILERERVAQKKLAQLEKANEALQQRDRILEATTRAANALLTIEKFDEAVNTALQIIGESLDCDRVCLGEHCNDLSGDTLGFVRYSYEWTSPYTFSQIQSPDAAEVSYEGIEAEYQLLCQGQALGGPIDEYSEPFRSEQKALGVKSGYAIPIMVEGKYWGIVGFDDCREPKHRSWAEIAVLKTSADCIGSAIARQRTQQALLQAEQARVADLAKTNTALKNSLDRLAANPDLNAFLGYVTLEAVSQLAADAGHLTIFNQQRETLSTAVHVQQERIIPISPLATEMAICEVGAIQILMATRQPRFFDVEKESHLFWAGAVEYHQQHHHRAVLAVPLYAGGKYLGNLGLAFTQSDPISEQESELLQALANQAALAIQLTQLAEEAKLAAIAREQEKAATQRAAELSKANEALRRSVIHLTTTDSLHSFLVAVLKEASQASGAISAAVFVYEPSANTLQQTALVLWNEVVDIACDPRAEIWRTPVPADCTNAWQIMSQERKIIWIDNDNPPAEHWSIAKPWHDQFGHKNIAAIPMLIGDRALGFLGLCFATVEQPSQSRLEQCWALAQHAALALQMAQLAQEAKLAAVLQEQEKAAQERVAELAKANNALKQSLDVLATEPDLDKLIGHVLRAIAHQFQSPLSEYWYHSDGNTAYLGMISWQGQIYNREEIVRLFPFLPGIDGFQVPPEMIHGESLQKRKHHFIQDLSTSPFLESCTWKEIYYQTFGDLSKELNLPLILGDDCIGALIIRLPSDRHFTVQQIELAQALAHQATLAVKLTQLAQESRQASLLEERNRMAREIHDVLAQAFTGILMQLQAATRFVATKPEQSSSCIARAQDLAREGLAEARRSVWYLYQSDSQHHDLLSALTRITEQLTAETSVQAQVRVQGTPYSLNAEVGMNLLRIGQESLTNALRHAQAQTIHINLTYESDRLQLRVRDDGRGFEPQHQISSGFGLKGMQQRCDRIGAQLEIHTQPGVGTEVIVVMPLTN